MANVNAVRYKQKNSHCVQYSPRTVGLERARHLYNLLLLGLLVMGRSDARTLEVVPLLLAGA